jgi:hypothetical protein
VQGRRRHFIQRAVHAVADFKLGLEGLEVNVAGFFLDGLCEHQIDEANDGRAVGVGFLVFALVGGEAELLEDFVETAGAGAVMLVDQRLHLGGPGDHRDDVLAQGEAQILDQLRVHRVRERHVHGRGGQVDGEGTIQFGHGGRHHRDQLGRGLEGAEVEVLRADFLGHDGPKFVLGAVNAKVQQHLKHVLAAFIGLMRDIVSDAIVDDTAVCEHVHDVLGSHGRENLKVED